MRVSSFIAAALLQASLALSSPVEADDLVARGASKRPNHAIKPHHPGKPFLSSPARSKICTVKSYGNGKDDSQYVLNAIKSCNNGGHVVFSKGKTYTIGTALDLTFLKHIDLGTS
jgi:galacturan 1,4-alpha-galacturonidase